MADWLIGFGVGATAAAVAYLIYPQEQRWIDPKYLIPVGLVILAIGVILKYT